MINLLFKTGRFSFEREARVISMSPDFISDIPGYNDKYVSNLDENNRQNERINNTAESESDRRALDAFQRVIDAEKKLTDTDIEPLHHLIYAMLTDDGIMRQSEINALHARMQAVLNQVYPEDAASIAALIPQNARIAEFAVASGLIPLEVFDAAKKFGEEKMKHAKASAEPLVYKETRAVPGEAEAQISPGLLLDEMAQIRIRISELSSAYRNYHHNRALKRDRRTAAYAKDAQPAPTISMNRERMELWRRYNDLKEDYFLLTGTPAPIPGQRAPLVVTQREDGVFEAMDSAGRVMRGSTGPAPAPRQSSITRKQASLVRNWRRDGEVFRRRLADSKVAQQEGFIPGAVLACLAMDNADYARHIDRAARSGGMPLQFGSSYTYIDRTRGGGRAGTQSEYGRHMRQDLDPSTNASEQARLRAYYMRKDSEKIANDFDDLKNSNNPYVRENYDAILNRLIDMQDRTGGIDSYDYATARMRLENLRRNARMHSNNESIKGKTLYTFNSSINGYAGDSPVKISYERNGKKYDIVIRDPRSWGSGLYAARGSEDYAREQGVRIVVEKFADGGVRNMKIEFTKPGIYTVSPLGQFAGRATRIEVSENNSREMIPEDSLHAKSTTNPVFKKLEADRPPIAPMPERLEADRPPMVPMPERLEADRPPMVPMPERLEAEPTPIIPVSEKLEAIDYSPNVDFESALFQKGEEMYEQIKNGKIENLSNSDARSIIHYLNQKGEKNAYLSNISALSQFGETAREIAQFKGKMIFLSGLTGIDAEIAEELSKFEGEIISLTGLKGMNEETKKALKKFKGTIMLPTALKELFDQ